MDTRTGKGHPLQLYSDNAVLKRAVKLCYEAIDVTLLQRSSTGLTTKAFSYAFHIQPLSLKGYCELLQSFVTWISDKLHGSGSNFDCYLRNGIVVRSWDGYLFYARPRTSDLYAICCEEVYELKNWFKPHAKGVVVDVGAYIGTYTVRAMYSADLVIAIEPLPYNFRILQTNIRLNLHKQKSQNYFDQQSCG